MPTIPICRALLHPTRRVFFTNEQLRGFLGYFFIDDAEFHHHGPRAYHYPLVQYKQIGGSPLVLGIGPYADVVQRRISEVARLVFPSGTLDVRAIEITLETHELTFEPCNYEFITPWIALNQANYRRYTALPPLEKKQLLERILVGNILSFLKCIGVFASTRLTATLAHAREVKVSAHHNDFLAFRGAFTLNLSLPNYLGIGKSASKGFGTIRRIM
ncbi:MAG: CRISPR-associated endonuclease Cas6 [Candidatus Micrarchaeia archaeon]